MTLLRGSPFLAVAAATSIAACGLAPQSAPEAPLPPAANLDEARSDLARVVAPAVPATDLAALVAGNNAFAADLYKAVRAPGMNLMASPASISIALAMTYAGAKGQTAIEMAKALHFDLPQDQLHPAFDALDLALASRGQNARGQDGNPFRLKIANALWGQKGYPFVPDFLDTLALNYGAGLTLLDFIQAPEPSRLTINQWVEERTEGKIKDLLKPENIDEGTRLVLTNAVYFNASWMYPFDPAKTVDGAFHLLDGSPVVVPVMSQDGATGGIHGLAFHCDDFDAVELPYDGYELSMVIVAPAPGRFEAFEEGMSSGVLEAAMSSLEDRVIFLSMPKFKFEWRASLADALKVLGMEVPFELGVADFTGMSPTGELFIGDVIHQTFIGVDEKGTEAAAATAVVMEAAGMPPPVITMSIDRPFVFSIRDRATGQIVFLGRVVDPR